MSVVDYTQIAEDHASVLILVQQVGSHLAAKSFTRIFDRLSKLHTLKIPKQHRTVNIRYTWCSVYVGHIVCHTLSFRMIDMVYLNNPLIEQAIFT